MGKIIILGSEKGGVAKTTSTYNLAYCLAKEGKKVLAVDFDSQANLSTCFGIEDTGAVPVTIGHLMMQRIEDEELPDAAQHPLCEQCLAAGVAVPVEEVHHKIPLSEGGTHDRGNLISLCKSCHSRIHAERGDRWGR